MKKKILILGASGFIGKNIALSLAKISNYEIHGTYLKSNISKIYKKNNIRMHKVNLTNSSDVNRIIRGKDIVIQASAVTTGIKDVVKRPYIHVTDNAVMNSLIFRSCFENKIKHLVFFSCTTMYPSSKKKTKEVDFNHNIVDKYFGVGWTKVYIEKMCDFYSRISNTKFTVIRHSNIYGPYDKYDFERSHVLGATVSKVRFAENENLEVWGDGKEIRDLLYIDDLVNFVKIIIKKQKKQFDLINIGLGKGINIKQLTKLIIKTFDKKIKLKFNNLKPTIKFNLVLSYNKAQNEYGWKPKTSLEKGIIKTINWHKLNIFMSKNKKIIDKSE